MHACRLTKASCEQCFIEKVGTLGEVFIPVSVGWSKCIAVQKAIVSIHTEDGRITLLGNRLRIFKDALVDEKELGSDAEFEAALKEHFNIVL